MFPDFDKCEGSCYEQVQFSLDIYFYFYWLYKGGIDGSSVKVFISGEFLCENLQHSADSKGLIPKSKNYSSKNFLTKQKYM